MSRREWTALVLVLALTGLGAVVLRQRQAAQRLGIPGVRVVSEPALGESNRVIGPVSAWLPPAVAGWASRSVPVARIVEEWLPRDTVYGHRVYTAPDGFAADLNIVLMGADRSSIHQPQYCLAGSGWRIEREETRSIRVERPRPYDLPVRVLHTLASVREPNGATRSVRGLFVYWFVADGQLTASHKQMQWWIARDLLRRGVLQRWAYVACMGCGAPGQEEALFGRMARFLAAAVPEFQLAAGPPDDTLALKPGPAGP